MRRYLILGSDGLYDVLQNKTIGRVAGKMNSSAQKVSNELQKELRKKPTGDDTTMLVVALNMEPNGVGGVGSTK